MTPRELEAPRRPKAEVTLNRRTRLEMPGSRTFSNALYVTCRAERIRWLSSIKPSRSVNAVPVDRTGARFRCDRHDVFARSAKSSGASPIST
jgi:hypothetical protein